MKKIREAQIVLQASCLALYIERGQFSNLMPPSSYVSLLGRDPFPLLHCSWTHLLPLIQDWVWRGSRRLWATCSLLDNRQLGDFLWLVLCLSVSSSVSFSINWGCSSYSVELFVWYVACRRLHIAHWLLLSPKEPGNSSWSAHSHFTPVPLWVSWSYVANLTASLMLDHP